MAALACPLGALNGRGTALFLDHALGNRAASPPPADHDAEVRRPRSAPNGFRHRRPQVTATSPSSPTGDSGIFWAGGFACWD